MWKSNTMFIIAAVNYQAIYFLQNSYMIISSDSNWNTTMIVHGIGVVHYKSNLFTICHMVAIKFTSWLHRSFSVYFSLYHLQKNMRLIEYNYVDNEIHLSFGRLQLKQSNFEYFNFLRFRINIKFFSFEAFLFITLSASLFQLWNIPQSS